MAATGPDRSPARASVPVPTGVRLRPLGPADADVYVRIYTDPLLMRGIGVPLSWPAAHRSFDRACRRSGAPGPGPCWWTIVGAAAGEGVGLAGLDHDGQAGEIGAIVERRHQGAGIGGQALAMLVEHAFTALALAQVRIRHRPDNRAMAAIAARLGARRVDPADPSDLWLWCLRAPARRAADLVPSAD